MRLAAMLICLLASSAFAETIVGARFIAPTQHYAHGILGDTTEYGGMMVELSSGQDFLVGFPPRSRVFEDIAPRLWDLTGDSSPEVVVIETNPPEGAQLAVYGVREGAVFKIAATPHIGRTNRWLAPIGAADLDGDGHIEVAYIDRPHLAKTLRVWRFKDQMLEPVADLPGFTNHRIGETDIAGGIRVCGGVPEMIVARSDWARVMAITFQNGTFAARDLGPHKGRESFAHALKC
ncbi:FG-GAP repeat domain-containing protein [Sulfitobacter aestuariivivens]|uniref:VCBS repeat-containing protein n=1 Tax=Sulfitobacter aestuariivivens TaxID=2766981 RepID=A0A927HDL8_9RHOB|nr:VCBS repeat-containing protein [Sulfitobacter aestuariivivens]MBD3662483.1 VCBS repeat-containing protein [Sulfitobacter aestuariivivens]